jgi:hypothetical protein
VSAVWKAEIDNAASIHGLGECHEGRENSMYNEGAWWAEKKNTTDQKYQAERGGGALL